MRLQFTACLAIAVAACASTPRPVEAAASIHAGCHGSLAIAGPLWSPPTYDDDEELLAASRAWVAKSALLDRVVVDGLEAASCSFLSESDRTTNPLLRRDDIREVVRVLRRRAAGVAEDPVVVAVLVKFDARPGLTPEWVRRALDCHAAQDGAAVAGGQPPEQFPLATAGGWSVEGTPAGVTVRLVADDESARALVRAMRPRVLRIARCSGVRSVPSSNC